MPNNCPTYLSTLSGNTPIPAFAGAFTSVTFTAAWPVANRAIYVPFFIPAPFTVQRFTVAVATAICNIDVGVFDFAGNKIGSTGSTASAKGSTLQYINPAGGAFKLQPGRYYWALACDSGAAGCVACGNPAATVQGAMEMTGCLQQDTAFPLPSTFSPAEIGAQVYPLMGATQTAS